MKHEGSDVAVTHSHVATRQVCVHDKVDDILLYIELHRLVKCLEAVIPRFGKEIMEEALRSKGKKG